MPLNKSLSCRLETLRWRRLALDAFKLRIKTRPGRGAARPYVRGWAHGRRIVQRTRSYNGELRPSG
jgi:hypothetical protein